MTIEELLKDFEDGEGWKYFDRLLFKVFKKGNIEIDTFQVIRIDNRPLRLTEDQFESLVDILQQRVEEERLKEQENLLNKVRL